MKKRTATQLGMVGLSRMGSNRVRRLIRGGVQCVVCNRSPEKARALVKEKAIGAASLAELVQKLQKPRAVWLKVPAAIVDTFIAEPLPLPESGDILIYARFAFRGATDFQGRVLTALGDEPWVRRPSGEIREVKNDA